MKQGEQKQPEEPLAIERLTIDELLELRRNLRDESSDEFLEGLDEELTTLAQRDKERAADIFEALAQSSEDDRDAAAIYLGALLATNRERALPLFASLLQDENDEVRAKAFETLEIEIDRHRISMAEAVPLAQAYFAKNTEEASEA